MDPQKQKILLGIQQNSPSVTGVEFKFGFSDEAQSFFASLSTNTYVKNLKNKTLTYVDLGNCSLTLDGLIELSKGLYENASIKAIRIGPFSKKAGIGVEHVLSKIVDKKNIVRLELLGPACSDIISFSKTFGKYLPRNNLTYLSLDSMGLTDEAFQIIAPALPLCKTLSTLLLHRNKITLPGVKALSKGLLGQQQTQGPVLKRFGMCGTDLRNLETMTSLLPDRNGMAETLKELELSGCKISNDGAVVVFQLIVSNKPLARVDLSENEILNLRSLNLGKNTTTLTDLNLAGNKLSEESLSQLSQELPTNRALTRLNISRNSFSPESAKQFLNPVILASSKLRELITDSKVPPLVLQTSVSPGPSTQVSPHGRMSRTSSFSTRPSMSAEDSYEAYNDLEAQLSIQLSRVRAASVSRAALVLPGGFATYKPTHAELIALRSALLPEMLHEMRPYLRSRVIEELAGHVKLNPELADALASIEPKITEAIIVAARARFIGANIDIYS